MERVSQHHRIHGKCGSSQIESVFAFVGNTATQRAAQQQRALRRILLLILGSNTPRSREVLRRRVITTRERTLSEWQSKKISGTLETSTSERRRDNRHSGRVKTETRTIFINCRRASAPLSSDHKTPSRRTF